MRLPSYIVAFAFPFTLCPVSAKAQNTQGIAAWRPDLQTIAKELPARHPNAFYRMTPASWDSAVASIHQRLPTMTRN